MPGGQSSTVILIVSNRRTLRCDQDVDLPGTGTSRVVSIIRHDDGSLTVPVAPGRHDDEVDAVHEPDVVVIRPGQGGYIEALAEWEADQHPDRGEAVSTASGRRQAMAAVHSVAEDRDNVVDTVDALGDPEPGAEALRHVLVGGTPSVEAFAGELADAQGGEMLAPHTMTSIIGEVLAEIDKRTH